MKMEVEIKTKVEHPEESGAVHEHDSPAVNFGCSDPWFVAGDDGTEDAGLPRSGRHRRPHPEEPDDRRGWASIPTTTATSASRI